MLYNFVYIINVYDLRRTLFVVLSFPHFLLFDSEQYLIVLDVSFGFHIIFLLFGKIGAIKIEGLCS